MLNQFCHSQIINFTLSKSHPNIHVSTIGRLHSHLSGDISRIFPSFVFIPLGWNHFAIVAATHSAISLGFSASALLHTLCSFTLIGRQHPIELFSPNHHLEIDNFHFQPFTSSFRSRLYFQHPTASAQHISFDLQFQIQNTVIPQANAFYSTHSVFTIQ